MTSRIGLLGGTFDPIHNGHIAIIKTAIQQLKLDKLLLIPAGNPWQKSEFIDSKHRLEMVKKAGNDLEKVEVSDIEVNKTGPTYTFETLQELHKKYPNSELILILGSDAVAGFDTWKEPNLVKTLARIYVVQRAGDFTQDWHFDRIQMPPIEISSTEIREKVKNNESISELVPKLVNEYISANGLYKK
jgi:nicotinate-nucleotide adenylyltransferase